MKTIILLSDFRSGSTALLRAMTKHPKVHIPHTDRFSTYRYGRPSDWEMAYWSYGQKAIEGDYEPFIKRMSISNPFIAKRLRWLLPYTEEKLFDLWDSIVDRYGPIVFEKSPQYLENWEALYLIFKYSSFRNVKLLSIIRNPKDCIPSQALKWTNRKESDFQEVEGRWIKKYRNLQRLKQIMPVYSMSYEDLVFQTKRTFLNIFQFCNLEFYPNSCLDIKPTHYNYYHQVCSYKPSSEAEQLYRELIC